MAFGYFHANGPQFLCYIFFLTEQSFIEQLGLGNSTVCMSYKATLWKGEYLKGVSSIRFPSWFPFHCELISPGISSQSVQNILTWHVTLNERPILILSLLRFSEITSKLITFNHLRCHSSSTALGTRTAYWKPTRRGTDETP